MTYPTIMPALTLDFQNSQQLDPRVTFSRSSSATYTNSAGQVASAADHEARFDHDGNGECLGLLIEKSRTNLIEYSQDFTQSYWTKNSVTIAVASVLAPDGTNTATQVTDSVENLFVGEVYVDGAYISNYPVANIPENKWNRYSTSFTFSSGTTFVMVTRGSGTMRRSVDAVLTAGTYTYSVYAYRSGTDLYVWGAQLEEDFPSSYIPTSGSTVTRSADIAQVTTADIYGDEFTIINTPFGVSSGGPTLHLQGHPHVERAAVYNEYLSQEQINTVTGVDEFWRWRVFGSSWEIKPKMDGSVTVDWGDGTTESLSNNVLVNHTFTNGSGYHEVGFRLDSGSWLGLNMNYSGAAASREKVVAVGPMPANMVTSGGYMYNYASNITAWDANLVHRSNHSLLRTYSGLTSLKSFPFTVLGSLVTNFDQVFLNCSNLNSFPLIDTSSIDGFGRTWEGCGSLTSFPHINTSLGEKFNNCWYNCASLTSFPLLDTSSATNFQQAWRNCSGLTSFPLLDTSSGTNFIGTWRNCNSLPSFPLIDTSSGTDFKEAWMDCNSLTSFPQIDTSSGVNFYFTWYDCSSLTSFPLIDTSSGTNFREAWRNCTSLTSFPLIDTSSATDLGTTWYNCSSLTSFPLIDTSGVPSFSYTWAYCSALTSFPLLNTSSCGYFGNAWQHCTNLANFPANFFDTTGTITDSNAFKKTFTGCALTAQSIENILVSLDTNGASGITLHINQGTNAAQSSWSTAANTALTNLQTKGWTVNYNP